MNEYFGIEISIDPVKATCVTIDLEVDYKVYLDYYCKRFPKSGFTYKTLKLDPDTEVLSCFVSDGMMTGDTGVVVREDIFEFFQNFNLPEYYSAPVQFSLKERPIESLYYWVQFKTVTKSEIDYQKSIVLLREGGKRKEVRLSNEKDHMLLEKKVSSLSDIVFKELVLKDPANKTDIICLKEVCRYPFLYMSKNLRDELFNISDIGLEKDYLKTIKIS